MIYKEKEEELIEDNAEPAAFSRTTTMAPRKHQQKATEKNEKIKVISNTLGATVKVKSPEYKWSEEEILFENSIRHKELWVDSFFIYAIIWAFGSILTEHAKVEFDRWIKKCFESQKKERERQDNEKD